MMKLDPGNVLLKPSQRRQLMTRLRRSLKLGQRIGQFILNLTLHRCGRCCEIIMRCEDKLGRLAYRSRRHDWRDALRDIARRLEGWLHEQSLTRAA